MSVRDDRLMAEYEAMKKFRSTVISWSTLNGYFPPDHYRIEYQLRSIIGFDERQRPIYHTGFTVDIKFPIDYPRGKPEVFFSKSPQPIHPNIWEHGHICLEGDQHWIPGIGVSLESLCFMIGEIIAYQEVNTHSPAYNKLPLRNWVSNNIRYIEGSKTKVANPVDSARLREPNVEDLIKWG